MIFYRALWTSIFDYVAKIKNNKTIKTSENWSDSISYFKIREIQFERSKSNAPYKIGLPLKKKKY